MTKPIALQLYSLRDQCAQDFEGVVRQVAAIGYAGVETAGFPPGTSPARAKALFDELGLTVCAAHSPLPLDDKQAFVLETMAALGSDRLVSGHLPAEMYATPEKAASACDRLNAAAAVATANGLRFGIHNHWWEFEPFAGESNGRKPYQLWLERLDPAIFFELDAYWAAVGGIDPLDALAALGDRVELLHVKDGPADVPASDMTAVSQGVMDYTRIIPAATAADWLIVEIDRCATDMMTAVEQSFRYLTEKGLGHGRL